MERTLIILKPDAVQRGLLGTVLNRFERRGFSIAGMKMVKLSHALLEEHYAHLKGKPFFPALLAFMSSSPVVVAVIEGKDAVEMVRKMCGATNAGSTAAMMPQCGQDSSSGRGSASMLGW